MDGDEEEDDIDDVENEFNFDLNKEKDCHSHTPKALQPQVSLLTNGQEVIIPHLTRNSIHVLDYNVIWFMYW